MLALQKFVVAALFLGDEDPLHSIHVFGEQQAGLSNGPQRPLAGLVATTVTNMDQSPFFAQQCCRGGRAGLMSSPLLVPPSGRQPPM
jgi:hypothetical protein